MSVVPLEDVKAHLNLRTFDNDDEIAFFIDAAESAIAKRLGSLSPRVVTRRLYRSGPVSILPDRYIIGDVDGGSYYAGTLEWDSATPYGWVDVTYTVGFDPLPADIKLGVMEMVRHLWSTQRGNATNGGARADMLGVAGEPTTAAGMAAYSLPNRVKELLAPYMPQSSIA